MQQMTPANYRFKRKMIGERIVCKIGARRRKGGGGRDALLGSGGHQAGWAITLHIWGQHTWVAVAGAGSAAGLGYQVNEGCRVTPSSRGAPFEGPQPQARLQTPKYGAECGPVAAGPPTYAPPRPPPKK